MNFSLCANMAGFAQTVAYVKVVLIIIYKQLRTVSHHTEVQLAKYVSKILKQ